MFDLECTVYMVKANNLMVTPHTETVGTAPLR
jgi:hypothetical protein